MSLQSIKKNNAITHLIGNFNSVNLKDIMVDFLAENTALIEDLNAEQLEAGVRADSTTISPKYSPKYAEFKKGLGFDVSKVNLRLEGDYHKGITAKVTKYEINITNTDKKDGKLDLKYGGSLMGLTKDSRIKLNSDAIIFMRNRLLTLLLR